MQNAIVLNLGRFGDLLQTQAVFNVLKNKKTLNNQAHYYTTLICIDNFRNTTELMQSIDNIVSFNGSHLLAQLDSINTAEHSGWLFALNALQTWLDSLTNSLVLNSSKQANEKQLLINLTPSLSARILLHLIKLHLEQKGIECESQGFIIDEFGFGKNTTTWASYLMSSCQARGQSCFNIVDVFLRCAGLDNKSNDVAEACIDSRLKTLLPLDLEKNKKFLASLLPPSTLEKYKGFVCFQLGASQETRRWSVKYFAQVGRQLWEEEKICPILLGTKAESVLANEYLTYSKNTPFIDLSGKTNLQELALTLKNSRLLISNDTGTMHLAAGLGVDIIAIFLTTAQAWDTGPYLKNAYSLEPELECHPCEFGVACKHDYKCRSSIAPELVFSLALAKLQGTNKADYSLKANNKARIWAAEYNHNGFLILRSLSGHENEERSILWLLLSHFQSQLLDRKPNQPIAILNDKLFLSNLKNNTVLKQALLKESQLFIALFLLFNEQGKMLLNNPVPLIKSRFLATWQRLQTSMLSSKYFSSFAKLWIEESQQNADDLLYVLELSISYHNIFIGISKSLELSDQ